MANVTCFLRAVQNVEDLGNEMYRVAVGGLITDAAQSAWQADFVVNKQPTQQFRRRIRDAVVAHILSSLGETVTFLVWPDLEGEDI